MQNSNVATNINQKGGLGTCCLHMVCICFPHFRVRVERVTSTTALSQHLQQQVLSQQDRGAIELETLPSQGHRGNVTSTIMLIFIGKYCWTVSFSLAHNLQIVLYRTCLLHDLRLCAVLLSLDLK